VTLLKNARKRFNYKIKKKKKEKEELKKKTIKVEKAYITEYRNNSE